MPVTRILAGLPVADLDTALPWYERLFDRPADARPMDGLAEWHVPDGGALQVTRQPDHAGHGSLTLSVDDLGAESARLTGAGLEPGPIDDSSQYVRFAQLSDLDGNAVTLVEPR